MANEYLVQIHDYITEKMAAAEKLEKRAKALGDHETRQFYAGQINELDAIRHYLSEHVDLKTQTYY